MISIRKASSATRSAVLCFTLVIATIFGSGVAPRTFAAGSRAAAASTARAAVVTTNPVNYHLVAQLLSGARAGATIAGQVSGMLDSTGILTATLTLASGASAKVKGTGILTSTLTLASGGSTKAKGMLVAPAKIIIAGNAANMTLSGGTLNKMAGIWGGMVAMGMTANVGSWTLTPETQAVSFSMGGKSAAGSKDKLALAGQLDLQLTADGWGEGTYSSLSDDTVLHAEGRVSNGNITATIFWPKKGMVLLVASGVSKVGVLKWTGTFVGPGQSDFGTFVGEG